MINSDEYPIYDDEFPELKELPALLSSRNSFYHKALTYEALDRRTNNLMITLVSYEKKTVSFIPETKTFIFYPNWESTLTTLSHVKDFLFQMYEPTSDSSHGGKNQILRSFILLIDKKKNIKNLINSKDGSDGYTFVLARDYDGGLSKLNYGG